MPRTGPLSPPGDERPQPQGRPVREGGTDLAVASMAGDGIGPEVVDAALDVLQSLETRPELGVAACIHEMDYNSEVYQETGKLFDGPMERELRRHDLILFGALGAPSVRPGVLERGVILAMRSAFDQAVNVRPVRLYPGVRSPVEGVTEQNCDLVFVRENLEGAYASGGSSVHAGTPYEVALQESVNTAPVIRRAARYALELAGRRQRRLTLCHKSNILTAAGDLWQRIVKEEAQAHPDIGVEVVNADAMCLHLPLAPGRFDVVLTDNLFGDILTDLGAMVQGGIGLSSSANINLEGTAPSMVEGVHGSAPDIAGRGWASPYATILSLALGLADCGRVEAAKAVEAAVAGELVASPVISGPDLPGGTRGVGRRIAQRVTQGGDRRIESSLMGSLRP